jgi:hypothetical protein
VTVLESESPRRVRASGTARLALARQSAPASGAVARAPAPDPIGDPTGAAAAAAQIVRTMQMAPQRRRVRMRSRPVLVQMLQAVTRRAAAVLGPMSKET